MNQGLKKIEKNWYLFLIGGLLFLQAAVFLIFRENSYLAVHDNLDLFVTQLKMLKDSGTFFAQGAEVAMLGGINRDNFGSEFSLYNILFYLLPNFWAYMTGYVLKIAIGIFSFYLLAREVYGEKYKTYKPLIWVIATAYGLIPVFPAYGICFTSIPIIVFLLRRIYHKPSLWLFLGVFCYPLVSYFSYFGFFILAYIVCAVIILWIKDKRFPKWIALSCVVLAAGYMLFEYRLFREMLFSDAITIRGTMVDPGYSFVENIKAMWDMFVNSYFHAQDSHKYWILPVCFIGIILINIGYIRKKEFKKMLTDSCNLTFGFILFNVIVYGMYFWEGFRNLVFTLIPKLDGFQYGRTYFFNPFLWYALLFLLLKRLYDTGKDKWMWLANGIAAIAVLIVMFVPQTYNDFYYTCYLNAYSIIKQTPAKDLNYREFFSEDLFEEIKEEIGYNGEWSVAYGMHPAVLQFNGIATLDGYLGFYEQEYKEAFRKVIAPALENNEWARENYDEWGARAYLYSTTGENVCLPYRTVEVSDDSLPIDTEAFGALDGKYVFSRIEINNRDELGLKLKGTYSNETSPYVIYLYELQ